MPMTGSRPLQGRRALIVEDDALFALAMTEALAGLGCTVVDVAPGLVRALAAAEFHELDLAVVDVNLGEDKAFRVAHMLMARDVPFVFATGGGRDAISPEFAQIPALEKPFTPRQLEALLISVLEAREDHSPAPNPQPGVDVRSLR